MATCSAVYIEHSAELHSLEQNKQPQEIHEKS